MSDHNRDVLIVGAGPIGIELAVALADAGVDADHVDAGQIGATLQWWAPGTQFFSSPERLEIAGVPLPTLQQSKPLREEYLAYLRQVVAQFDLPIRTYTRVTDLRAAPGGGFDVQTRCALTGTASTMQAGAVVLAIGDMHRPHTLGVPGEDLPHVSHYLEDPHRYFRRRVLIVGGKNSAVEAAIRLHRIGCDVTISYRREGFDAKRVKYWLRPELEWLIDKKRIGFLPRTVPVRLVPGGAVLAGCDDTGTPVGGPEQTVSADFVLLLTGYEQDPALFQMAGVDLLGQGAAPRYSRRTMETNVPGLYVAGTAAAGTQLTGVKVFIETSHVHVERIVQALTGHGTGRAIPDESEHADLPEA